MRDDADLKVRELEHACALDRFGRCKNPPKPHREKSNQSNYIPKTTNDDKNEERERVGMGAGEKRTERDRD